MPKKPLPLSLPPRGICREEAAAYIGIGTTTFDRMVSDGRMPRPKAIGGRRVWDVRALDLAFSALPSDGEMDAWDAAWGSV
jgi:excisionase family DNA binding protein